MNKENKNLYRYFSEEELIKEVRTYRKRYIQLKNDLEEIEKEIFRRYRVIK